MYMQIPGLVRLGHEEGPGRERFFQLVPDAVYCIIRLLAWPAKGTGQEVVPVIAL